jgi:hypothetical protein
VFCVLVPEFYEERELVENEGEKTKFLVVYILATIKANLDFN